MRILVTAGNTQTPVDEVRVITNVFSGRTGTRIAASAAMRGHAVTLLTSHPELVEAQTAISANDVHAYRTFEDLQRLMEMLITADPAFDAIIHCAAVSDYQLVGSFVPAEGTYFNSACGTWELQTPPGEPPGLPRLVDVSRGKIKSSHPELWLRLVPTPKLIDQIRAPWGFHGTLVKFKLEVGASDEELLQIADASRQVSQADLMVANTYAGMHEYALLGPVAGEYQRVARADLAERLVDEVERLASR